jgi:phospholipase C
VASIVNAIGNSWNNSNHKCDYWGTHTHDTTAIIVTWDDWGGWYDHEAPLILRYPEGGYQLGSRVPLVFISAYTPAKFISPNRFDFGSVVRFVEQNYGIEEGALTFADARSGSDLKSFFNFNTVPRVFQTIAAPRGAEFFIRDTRPQTPADDD